MKRPSARHLQLAQRQVVATSILAAAEAVVAEQGLYAASIAAIARRAGVAVGTIYNYYDDRDALIQELFRQRRLEIAPRLADAAAAGAALPFEARLRRLLHDILAVFDAYGSFVRAAMEAEHLRPEPRSARGGRPIATQIVDALAAVLAAGAAEGRVPAPRVALHARLLTAWVREVVRIGAEDRRPVADQADLLADSFLRGAAAVHE